MDNLPVSAMITALTTLVAGFLGAFFNSYFNSIRTTREKLWELRRAIYGSILFHMSAIEHVLQSADSYIEEDAFRYFNDTAFNDHNKIINEHMQKIRSSFFENYLVISDPFAKVFEKFLATLDNTAPDMDPEDEHEHFAVTLRNARPELLRQARTEMPNK